MDKHGQQRPVSAFYALWLIVFVVDALLVGRGWDHRLGSAIFFVFFGGLIVGELRLPRDAGHTGDRDRDS